MGKLPDVFLFNPTCDFAIANGGSNWQPNKTLAKMERDLATLPMFFATGNDFVIVEELPTDSFKNKLKQLNFEIPQFFLKQDVSKNTEFRNAPKGKLVPWGWSPAAHKLLLPLKAACSAEFQTSPVYEWTPNHKLIASRGLALDLLNLLSEKINTEYIIGREQFPVICRSAAEIETAGSIWGKLMLKAPWSSSGRGLQPLTKTPIHKKVWEKINSVIAEQGFIMAEPLLNKVHDLAFLFELRNGHTQFLGVSNFFTNKNGQYEGNWLNQISPTASVVLEEFVRKCISELTNPLINIIDNSQLSKNYEGVFGIDMLIFRNNSDELQINPVLEINARHTMGMISLRLEQWLGPGKKGIFSIFYKPGTPFADFKSAMEQKHPLKMLNGEFHSGFLALTPADKSAQFGAYLLV